MNPHKLESNLINATEKSKELYKLGEKVTRDNLVSFMIMSFALSRGVLLAQQAFLYWYENTNNIKIEKLINDLLDQEQLSESEKEKLFSAYIAVKKHNSFGKEEIIARIEDDFKKALKKGGGRIDGLMDYYANSIESKDLDEFKENLNILIKEYNYSRANGFM